MKKARANTTSIENFLKEIDSSNVSSSLMICNAPKPAKEFVLDTFKYVDLGLPDLTATIFTLDR